MNKNIPKLYQISAKEERRIIGLMSGTSLDGLDIALCKYKGSGLKTEVTVERFTTVNYNEAFKAEIRKIFAKSTIDFLQLCVLHPYIAQKHAEMILSALKSWGITPEEVDVIASHGQTVYHAPKIQHQIDLYPNSTLQIGDGDHLSVATGIITLSDFRQKHCAAGGEGAPLAVYGDYLIFSQKGEDRILLNMGGIANFTYLPADLDADRVFATDTGTGNTLLDAYMQKHFGRAFDQDAQEASKGAVDIELLKALKDHSFFAAPVPKTTGPEVFNLAYLEAAQLRSNTITLSHSDVLATLCAFTADTIIACLSQSGIQPEKVFMSGGGMHNPLVVQKLKEGLPHTQFLRTDDLGIHGDAKEAVLFATLANEALAGGEISFGTKVPSVSMGKISFPH
jgi:anhydro-N-acetylmuramic acid kinase